MKGKDRILAYFDERVAEIQSDYSEILVGSNDAYKRALFELHDEVHLMMELESAREKLLEVLNGRAAQLR